MLKKKKMIIIFGPEAVGKMTVGQKLASITGYNLIVYDDFTNLCFKPSRTCKFKTVENILSSIFSDIPSSDIDGIIFTFPWNFDNGRDRLFVNQLIQDSGICAEDVYYIELDASQETRLFRNTTDNRLEHKPNKRNGFKSEKTLLNMDKTGRYHSSHDEFASKRNYLYIKNEDFTPTEAAHKIIEEFNLGGDYESN